MTDFEKLGVFYLGRVREPDAPEAATAEPLLYDAKDLTTHAVCVGMTGSGKTGLGIGLIEEAALDGIPSLIIDPKGDMGNLLLTFPELAAGDFLPYVDAGEAARKQLAPEAFAEKTAAAWSQGLESWGQDGARIARLKAAADFAIYTPGSRTGLPLSILSSLDAPPPGFADDAAAMRDRVSAAVSGLLALAGVEADPIQSREHILLANLVDREWRAGRNLDLGTLIHAIQEPGLDKIGILPLESFFPSKDRFGLAMRLNNLAASPGFSAWTEGEPLDVQRLLYTAEGRPRVSILSIAHLSDAERMFFVTVLLNEVLAWTRRQTGTSTLRALLYMDEIFGYFPPTANPPSKPPMLTLLKQARAFGLGIVLSTQNPVDLDYRGLSNTGTWFIGRLQTERDKMRVIEGLTGAAAGEGLDRGTLDRLMANLGSRVFLMRNVHEDVPVLFETRWCLSYLRGPLSPAQVGGLMAGRREAAPAAETLSAPKGIQAGTKMVVPASIPQVYLRPHGHAGGEGIVYRPALLATARLHFADARKGLDEWQTVRRLVPVNDAGEPDWGASRPAPEAEDAQALPQAVHAEVPAALADAKRHAQLEKDAKSWLLEQFALELLVLPAHKLRGHPGESEGEFRIRAGQVLREKREEALEAMRKKYAAKLTALSNRERRAEAKVENEKAQLSRQRTGTWIRFGTAALSVLMGRKAGGLGRAATGIGSMSRTGKEKLDVRQAEEALDAVQRQRADLEAEAGQETARVAAEYDPQNWTFEKESIRPRSSDTDVKQLALAWIPFAPDSFGALRPAIEI